MAISKEVDMRQTATYRRIIHTQRQNLESCPFIYRMLSRFDQSGLNPKNAILYQSSRPASLSTDILRKRISDILRARLITALKPLPHNRNNPRA